MSSFTGPLGNRAAVHADEILKLNYIDTLTAYVRVSSSNENLEGYKIDYLIRLDKFDKTLYENKLRMADLGTFLICARTSNAYGHLIRKNPTFI